MLPLLGLERFDRRALNRTLAGLTTTDRSVQIVLQADDAADTPTVVRDVFSLDCEALAPDTVGLQLGEAHDLLTAVQHTVVTNQVNTAITTQQACPHCGQARRHKDQRTIVLRTLFGALRPPSPCWWHCPCQPQCTRTFRPLAVLLLLLRSTPELVYLQAKFAALTSYAISAQLLAEVLPLGRRPDRPSCGDRCKPPRTAWRASSARSRSVSSTPANATATRWPARTYRSPSVSTAATCTPPPNTHDAMAGSR